MKEREDTVTPAASIISRVSVWELALLIYISIQIKTTYTTMNVYNLLI